MDGGKWLLVIMIALTASQMNGNGETIEISFLAGDDVDLECADNSSDTTRRLWKREDEIWLFVNDVIVHNDRVSSVNNSAILRISNVTLDDEGYYTCTAYTQPKHTRTVHLQVKDKPCETPQKPVNGGYESDTDGDIYKIGDTIRYYCSRGYRLIGQSIRNCTGNVIKGWEPDEPHCEAEYIDRIMRRLNGIKDKVSAIERRITTVQTNTTELEAKFTSIDNKVSIIDKTMSSVENNSAKTESQLSSVVVGVSLLESANTDLVNVRGHLFACTNATRLIDPDKVSKCMRMQLGERNGQSVSEYRWVLDDYRSMVKSSWAHYYTEPFYHTVPGYKFKLKASIDHDTELRVFLQVLPGEFDQQIKWPFSKKYDITVMKNDGVDVMHKYFSGDESTCKLARPTSATDFSCFTVGSSWSNVWSSRQHILKDGSAVITFYLYN